MSTINDNRLRRLTAVIAALGAALLCAAGTAGSASAQATGSAPQLAAGTYGTCAIQPFAPAHRVYCWGSNASQQAGLGGGNRVTLVTRPYPVKGVAASPLALAVGSSSACVLIATARVGCWGKNPVGALGQTNLGGLARSFQSVAQLAGATSAATGVSVGTRNVCFSDSDGSAKCLGAGDVGQLGNGGTANSALPVAVAGLLGPAAGKTVVQTATGPRHSCVLVASGNVKCFGINKSGQLGIAPETTFSSAAPVDVPKLADNVTQIASQAEHSCALHAAGAISCWGANPYGQLGDGTIAPFKKVVKVSGLSLPALQVATGVSHSCALLKGGAVMCWGSNEFGQLGNGTTTASSTPVSVIGLPRPATEITTGGYHSCARMDSGTILCWGRGTKGQLGDGTLSNSSYPRRVQAIGGVHFASVSLMRANGVSDLRATVVALPPRTGKLSQQCRTNAHLAITLEQDGQKYTRKLVKRLNRSGQTKCTARFSVPRISPTTGAAKLTLRGSYKGNAPMPGAALTEIYDLP